jgi:hypothetical protein
MGTSGSRPPMKRLYGKLSRRLESSSPKRTKRVRVCDFESRDVKSESSPLCSPPSSSCYTARDRRKKPPAAASVDFIDENDGGAGVRLRKRHMAG